LILFGLIGGPVCLTVDGAFKEKQHNEE